MSMRNDFAIDNASGGHHRDVVDPLCKLTGYGNLGLIGRYAPLHTYRKETEMKDYTDYSCTGQVDATDGKTDKGIKIACACATAGLLMLFALVGTAIAQDDYTPGEGAPALVAENGKALPGGKATDVLINLKGNH
jgi:hypothetical protein